MTEQAPDWVMRSYSTFARTNLARDAQIAGLSQEQVRLFNEWNQNVATQTGLAEGTIPVSGISVTGAVKTNAVGIAPATSVAVQTTNMLVSQNFSSPDTVVTQGNWSYDGEDGNLTLGCARVECNGKQDDLVSNEIPVIAGESIEVSCQAKWQDIIYTGTKPIVLRVQRYRKGVDAKTGGVTYLDLGGVDVAWLNAPAASGGWGTDGDLAGIYVVEGGVDQLRFCFRAKNTITAGVVKWDEAVFLKLDLIDDAAVPGVGATVDDIVRELFGSEGEGFTHNESAVALGNTSAAITSINARLSASEAEAGTGAVAGDDFPWSGEIIADANWGGVYTADPSNGHYAANGADAVWVPSVNVWADANQTALYDWQGTDSITDDDYQLIQLLLSSAPVTGPNNFKSYIHLLGRISSGFGSYIRASIGSNGTFFVDYFDGSIFTVMDSGNCAVPGSGTLLSLYCGDKVTTAPRHFMLKANQTTITEFDESGTGSSLGPSNRKLGWGGKAEGGYYLGDFLVGSWAQAVPPKINQWLGYDQ